MDLAFVCIWWQMLTRLMGVQYAVEDLQNWPYSGAVVLKLLGLRIPLHTLENTVEPKKFWLCRLYL